MKLQWLLLGLLVFVLLNTVRVMLLLHDSYVLKKKEYVGIVHATESKAENREHLHGATDIKQADSREQLHTATETLRHAHFTAVFLVNNASRRGEEKIPKGWDPSCTVQPSKQRQVGGSSGGIYNARERLRGYRPLSCHGCFFSDFSVLLENPELCQPFGAAQMTPQMTPQMVVMITTSIAGFSQRRAIRDTWASVTRSNRAIHVRHVFLLGTLRGDGRVGQDIKEESCRHKDMLVADFQDSYANLTLKTMVALRWIVRRCGDVKFFFKTDQDVYAFPERILDLALKNEKTLTTSGGLGGRYPGNGGKPHRDTRSRYYASHEAFRGSLYPPFVLGTGYLGTLTTARGIVEASPDVPFFHLEDVYLGMVSSRLGFRPTKFQNFALPLSSCSKENERGAPIVASLHAVSPSVMGAIWAKSLCGA